MVNQIDIWKAFIEAQEILLEAYSAPFSVIPNTLEHIKNSLYKVEVSTSSLQDKAADLIKNAFPNIPDENIDWENGIIKKHSDITVDEKGFKILKDNGPTFFLNVNHLPSINFKLQSTINDLSYFNLIIDRVPTIKNDIVFLKEEEIFKLLSVQNSCIELIKPFGAIFHIQPHLDFLHDLQNQFRSIIHHDGIDLSFDSEGDIFVTNKKISEIAIKEIESNLPFKAKNIKITFTIDNNELFFVNPIHYWRKLLGVYWFDEEDKESPSVILPRPRNKVFTFFLNPNIGDEGFHQNLNFLRSIFIEIFEEENVNIQYTTEFSFQPDEWWSKVANIIINKGFNISSDFYTASFDFSDLDYLNYMRRELLSVDMIQANDNGGEHLFKVHYVFTNPLENIKKLLKSEIPHLKVHYSRDSSSLICSYEFHPGPDNEHEKLIAINHIDQVIKSSYYENCLIIPPVIELGYEEYSFDFQLKDGIKELEQQLKRLKQEEIGYKSENHFETIGTLRKIDFPYIFFDIEDSSNNFQISEMLFGNIKGEKDKIQRLKETIEKIYNTSSKSCVNPFTKEVIKDSSKAKGIDDLERLQEFLDKLKEVTDTKLNPLLNPRQLEAVTKSLFAKDIFVIQGPPGTGKSTGISEIIWQHLRINPKQKILVTSETNLAVDNALDKLRSPFHNLIKPIRFGDETKLDKEGLRFSYNYIEAWTNNIDSLVKDSLDLEDAEIDDELSSNIVKDWMDRIAKYAGSSFTKEENHQYIQKWVNMLSNPDKSIKSMFFIEYVISINVVGATCSSIGKKSSTGSFTNFFKDYCRIYDSKSISAFKNGIANGDKTLIASAAQNMNRIEIIFDLVIQDEASKATPPEMALPMVYAKKNIVIGDHRQLPPMIDSNEFIQDILTVAEKSRDNKLVSRARTLAKDIKRNVESFTISHFERLYKNINGSLKTAFDTQYRMHPSINNVISQFYPINPDQCEYGLSCGLKDEFTEHNDLNNPESRYHGISIPQFIQPHHHVVWIDTSTPEIKLGTSRYNSGEIKVIEKLLKIFNDSPTYKTYQTFWNSQEDKQIGLITFYGAQLFRLLKLRSKFQDLPMRISTVDRFQGMERNIVIVSTVRSDIIAVSEDQTQDQCEPQFSLGFAEFPNRLNVALSRAKRLLIIVGNSNHFCQDSIYSNVVSTIKESTNGLYINANDFMQP